MDCCGPNSPYSPIPLLASLPCYVPHLLLDTGALKTTGGKAEVPSLHKEGWLRPLRKCRGASLAGADGVVGSSHRLSEVERTTPAAPSKEWDHLLDGAATPPLPRVIIYVTDHAMCAKISSWLKSLRHSKKPSNTFLILTTASITLSRNAGQMANRCARPADATMLSI